MVIVCLETYNCFIGSCSFCHFAVYRKLQIIVYALLNKTKPVKQQSPVVCIQGDSAFGFSGMEVETACRLAELCDLHVCHILCIMRF